MTGQNEGADGPDVGSLGEEAAKLLGALAAAARDRGDQVGDNLGGWSGQAAQLAHEVNEHIATDDLECKYCPVCRMVHAVRETSPEVRAHLISAASSLVQAAAELLDTLPPQEGQPDPSARGPEVEKIDLDAEEPDVP